MAVAVEVSDSFLKNAVKSCQFDKVKSTSYESFLSLLGRFRAFCGGIRLKKHFGDLMAGNKVVEDRVNTMMYPKVYAALDETLVRFLDIEDEKEEMRKMEADGRPYTKEEFEQFYGGLNEWRQASVVDFGVFGVLRHVEQFFRRSRFCDALKILQKTLREVPRLPRYEMKSHEMLRCLEEFEHIDLSAEEMRLLASALGLSTCPRAYPVVVGYLSNRSGRDADPSSLLQNVIAACGPSTKRGRDGSGDRVANKRMKEDGPRRTDGLCSHCLKRGHSKGVCRSSGRSEARLKEKYKSLREKAVEGVIPRAEVEKAFGGRDIKGIDQKEYVLINSYSVCDEEETVEVGESAMAGFTVHF